VTAVETRPLRRQLVEGLNELASLELILEDRLPPPEPEWAFELDALQPEALTCEFGVRIMWRSPPQMSFEQGKQRNKPLQPLFDFPPRPD